MLINVTYNPMKQYQNDFLEKLETNIDNSTCETANITMMGDYNLDYLTPLVTGKPRNCHITIWVLRS